MTAGDRRGVYSVEDEVTGEVTLVIDDPHIEALAAEVSRLRDRPVDIAVMEALERDVARLEAERSAVTAG